MGMQEKIIELLPEIDDIEDNPLRERVVAAWLAAIKHGGWAEDDLEEIPFTLGIENTEVNLFTHTRAVTRTAMAIADVFEDLYGDSLKINRELLIAGALLHDMGKLLESERNAQGQFQKSRSGKLLPYPLSGAILAGELGLPEEVLHVIARHCEETAPAFSTIERIIVQHADLVNVEALSSEPRALR